jgi:hypothetical protein
MPPGRMMSETTLGDIAHDRPHEDVDIRALDQKHVQPNMETPTWRGVWFPEGFSFPADRENPWRR